MWTRKTEAHRELVWASSSSNEAEADGDPEQIEGVCVLKADEDPEQYRGWTDWYVF